MSERYINPLTKRVVTHGSKVYNKLVDLGYKLQPANPPVIVDESEDESDEDEDEDLLCEDFVLYDISEESDEDEDEDDEDDESDECEDLLCEDFGLDISEESESEDMYEL